MSEAAIIAWTPPNWITIVLMVLVMYFVVGAVVRTVQQKKGKSTGS